MITNTHITTIEKPSGFRYGRRNGSVSTKITNCSYRHPENNFTIDCESTNFTSLVFNQCNVEVGFDYTVVNNSTKKINVLSLVDESFQNNIDESFTLPQMMRKDFFDVKEDIDICSDTTITKKLVLIGESINNNGAIKRLPLISDTVSFQSP